MVNLVDLLEWMVWSLLTGAVWFWVPRSTSLLLLSLLNVPSILSQYAMEMSGGSACVFLYFLTSLSIQREICTSLQADRIGGVRVSPKENPGTYSCTNSSPETHFYPPNKSWFIQKIALTVFSPVFFVFITVILKFAFKINKNPWWL